MDFWPASGRQPHFSNKACADKRESNIIRKSKIINIISNETRGFIKRKWSLRTEIHRTNEPEIELHKTIN